MRKFSEAPYPVHMGPVFMIKRITTVGPTVDVGMTPIILLDLHWSAMWNIKIFGECSKTCYKFFTLKCYDLHNTTKTSL